MDPTVGDQVIHICVAGKYFMDLSETSKTHLTFGALLSCYCEELTTDKAEVHL